jgi:hypothetical protein
MNEQDYQLGEDVTEQFAPLVQSHTAVLSVELSVDLLRELETVSEATGHSFDQIISSALSAYLPKQQAATLPQRTTKRAHAAQ